MYNVYCKCNLNSAHNSAEIMLLKLHTLIEGWLRHQYFISSFIEKGIRELVELKSLPSKEDMSGQ